MKDLIETFLKKRIEEVRETMRDPYIEEDIHREARERLERLEQLKDDLIGF